MTGRLPALQAKLLGLLLPTICLLSAVAGVLVYLSLYQAILHRFEVKLATTSGMVGAFIDPGDHALLAGAMREPGFSGPDAEQSPPYSREIAPMREVRRKLELTYLYTQVTNGPTKVRYVLDGTEGEEHTTVGFEDELPADTMQGLRGVEAHGRIYISPIQQQEAWGLLKTAAAPVWGTDGRISASVGADVNIGIIRRSTENALLICGLIGGISMLLAAASVSIVVNRVAQPLAAIKLAALKLAAGGYRLPSSRQELVEIEAIGKHLWALASRLEQTAAERLAAEVALRTARHDAEVARLLGQEPDFAILLEMGDRALVACKPSFVQAADGALWRHGLEAVASTACSGDQRQLRGLFEALGGLFIVLDRRSAHVTMLGGTLLIDDGKAEAWLPIGSGETRSYDPARSLRVSDGTGRELCVAPALEIKRVSG
jgi:hypothetical protein